MEYLVLQEGKERKPTYFILHREAFDFYESCPEKVKGVYRMIGPDTIGLINGSGDFMRQHDMQAKSGFKHRVI